MIKNNHLSTLFALDDNGDGSVTEFTLSGNYKLGGLTIIPEFRVDMTSEDSFLQKSDLKTLTPDKSLFPTVNVAAVYKF
jgi:hypothetical protein